MLSRLPQLRAPNGVRIRAPGAKTKRPRRRGRASHVVGDEGFRASAPRIRTRCGASRPLASCAGQTLSRLPQLRAPNGVRIRAPGAKTKRPRRRGRASHVVGDEGFRASAPRIRTRCGASRPLASCAGQTLSRLPQLRAPNGVRIRAPGAKTKRPRRRGRASHVVGDEGFEPPALCV